MERRSRRFGWPVKLLVAALAASTAVGCRSLVQTVAYVFQGTNVPADYDGLKGKVAVTCRVLSNQEFRNAGASRALAQEVGDLLKKNLKKNKIQLIDPQKVARIVDEKGLEDCAEIGKAVKADMVVAIEMESFSVLDGQTLFRGRAACSMKVYDMAEKEVVWKKRLPQSVFPVTGGIPMTDRTEEDFRQEFIHFLADQLARHFYAHDPHDDFGRDAMAMP